MAGDCHAVKQSEIYESGLPLRKWRYIYQVYPFTRIAVTCLIIFQGPVVQSVVSLMSSLRVISLTVLAVSIYNILIFFAEKM